MNNIIELWSVFVVCFYFITFIFILTDLEEIVLSNNYSTILIALLLSGILLGYFYH